MGHIFHRILLYSLYSGSYIHACSALHTKITSFTCFHHSPPKEGNFIEFTGTRRHCLVYRTPCLLFPCPLFSHPCLPDYSQFSRLYFQFPHQEKREMKASFTAKSISKPIHMFRKTKDHHPCNEAHCPPKAIMKS